MNFKAVYASYFSSWCSILKCSSDTNPHSLIMFQHQSDSTRLLCLQSKAAVPAWPLRRARRRAPSSKTIAGSENPKRKMNLSSKSHKGDRRWDSHTYLCEVFGCDTELTKVQKIPFLSRVIKHESVHSFMNLFWQSGPKLWQKCAGKIQTQWNYGQVKTKDKKKCIFPAMTWI